MTDYVSRDDVIEALYDLCNRDQTQEFTTKELYAIRAVPVADVRPVVLCRDCKNNYITTWNHGKQDDPRCDFTDRRLRLDDFCSRGESREEDGTDV